MSACIQEGWTPVQVACWDDCMKSLGELLKHRPNLDAKDDVRTQTTRVARDVSAPSHVQFFAVTDVQVGRPPTSLSLFS